MINKKEDFFKVSTEHYKKGKKTLLLNKHQRTISLQYNNVYEYIYLWFFYLYIQFLFLMGFAKKQKIIPTPNETFISKNKKRFLEAFEKQSLSSLNANMEDLFYDKKNYKVAVLNEDNDLEKKWKMKILFVPIPQTNIVMYYDVFKEGFAYYSDQHVSYDLLNVVAMKYVLIYKCFDLFIDNSITPVESPLLKNLKEEEEEDDEIKVKNIKKIMNDSKKTMTTITPQNQNPFAQLKHYNVLNHPKKKENSLEKEKEEQIIYKNKFINLGKMSNFSFIQKIKMKRMNAPPKKKIISNYEKKSERDFNLYVENWDKYTELQYEKNKDDIDKVFSSYKDYKKYQQTLKNCFNYSN